jgi:hypothetical protein
MAPPIAASPVVRRRWWLPLALAAGLLVACGATPPASPTPDPFAAVRRWEAGVQSYRYERTASVTEADGRLTIAHEAGAVQRPDRQHLEWRGRVTDTTEAREIIIVGQTAWLRRAILGSTWEPLPMERRPADPLTLTLGTLAAAGAPTPIGERQEADGRRCRGLAYPFDLARVPDWPPPTGGGALAAEASLWLDGAGAVCGQTVRVRRDGQIVAEFTLTPREINVPVTISVPN